MCGIIGILGSHEVSPQLVDALRRLEYRGYDSAGVATVDAQGRLDRRRAVGKLVNLSDKLVHEPLPGHAGIGHTRWATHGPATEVNAHPHQSGPVAVVHNGIIENFRELREELASLGIQPQSQTDTETVALWTAHYMDKGASPVEAARKTLARLKGSAAPDRFVTDRLALSSVVKRREHSGHWRRRRMALPSSAVGADATSCCPVRAELLSLTSAIPWTLPESASSAIFSARLSGLTM